MKEAYGEVDEKVGFRSLTHVRLRFRFYLSSHFPSPSFSACIYIFARYPPYHPRFRIPLTRFALLRPFFLIVGDVLFSSSTSSFSHSLYSSISHRVQIFDMSEVWLCIQESEFEHPVIDGGRSLGGVNNTPQGRVRMSGRRVIYLPRAEC